MYVCMYNPRIACNARSHETDGMDSRLYMLYMRSHHCFTVYNICIYIYIYMYICIYKNTSKEKSLRAPLYVNFFRVIFIKLKMVLLRCLSRLQLKMFKDDNEYKKYNLEIIIKEYKI